MSRQEQPCADCCARFPSHYCLRAGLCWELTPSRCAGVVVGTAAEERAETGACIDIGMAVVWTRNVLRGLDCQVAALIEAKEAWQSDVATPSDSECMFVRKSTDDSVAMFRSNILLVYSFLMSCLDFDERLSLRAACTHALILSHSQSRMTPS